VEEDGKRWWEVERDKRRKKESVKVKQNKIKNSYITYINIEVQNLV